MVLYCIKSSMTNTSAATMHLLFSLVFDNQMMTFSDHYKHMEITLPALKYVTLIKF